MDLRDNIDIGLWQAIKKNYENEMYTNAVLESIHMLTEQIKNKTGLELDGISLIDQAFGGDMPKIKLSKFNTKYGKSIQKGMHNILIGIYTAIRDPRNYSKFNDEKEDADAIIYFINHLLKLIHSSHTAFEESVFLNRIFDSHYVKSEEYSKLLVKKIPEEEKANIAIKVILKIEDGDISVLKYFMKELLKELSRSDMNQLFYVIDDLLKLTNEYKIIGNLLYIIPGEYWIYIDKAVGIRLDNILQLDVKNGQYDAEKCKLRNDTYGALGTWMTKEHLKSFCNVEEWTVILVDKLESKNEYEIQYVIKYFWNILCDINYENIHQRLIEYFKNQFRLNNRQIIERFLNNIMFDNNHPWWDVFKDELAEHPNILSIYNY